MNNLKEKLEDLAAISLYPITFTGERPCILNKWLYKYLDIQTPLAEAIAGGRILQQHELSFLQPDELRSNWRYYVSESDNTNLIYAETEDITDCKLCSVCCIYSSKKKDSYFYIRTSLPVSVYVNGRKICGSNYGYHIKPFSLIIELEEGINTLLVTQEISERYQELSRSEYSFYISVKPVSFIHMVDKEDIYYSSSIDTLYHSYYIVPVTYRILDELSFEIFRKYQPAGQREETVTVTVKDAFGTMLKCRTVTGERCVILLTGIRDGPLRVHCDGSGGDIFVFKGNYEEVLKDIKSRIDDAEFVNYIDHVFKLPASELVFNYGKMELIYEKILYILFNQFTRLLKASDSGKDIKEEYFWHMEPGEIITHLMKSDVDGAYMPFTFFTPDNYRTRQKNKAIIFMPYGSLMDLFPDIPSNIIRSEFQDFIVITVYGRGGLNRDFVSELQIVKIINYIYNLDMIDGKDKYAVGICSGALRAYGLAIRFPGMFTALASVGGTVRMDINDPQFEELKILEHTMIYNVCNIEDEFFNSSRVFHTNRLLKREKSILFDSFTHKEVTENLVTKKVAGHLLGHKGEIPSGFQWYPQENIYNRAYWVTVVQLQDIRKKTFLDIVVTSNGYRLKTDNIKELQIDVNEHHFSTEQVLTLLVNQHQGSITAGPDKTIAIRISEDGILCDHAGKMQSGFGLKEDSLGIKSIYLKRHAILKPARPIHDNTRITKKLIMIFRQPLREKERSYGYVEVEEASAANGASIIQFLDDMANLNNIVPFECREAEIVLYRLEKNLYVYTASLGAVEVLAKLMGKFDTDQIFLSTFIMYREGKFYYESNGIVCKCEQYEII